METQQTTAVTEEFIERMGTMVQADGLPRIAGRVMAFLVIHGGPVSFAELAERLRASRASISTNTRMLEQLGIVERVGKPGDRQDYFRLADAPYQRVLERTAERMAKAKKAAEDARRQLPPEWTGAQRRLGEFCDFYRMAGENTQRLIELLRRDSE